MTISGDAAHNLFGVTLPGNWKVIEKVAKDHYSTCGHFSVSYIVEREGKKAFLKVLDLGAALRMPGDHLKHIESLIKQFNFERDTLRICRQFGLKRVASAIDDGKMDLQGGDGVYYIVFELAEGDIRKKQNLSHPLDLAWKLRILHNTAVGLDQLHRKNIAHQDLKPSNVLVFGKKDSKVSDLGCADIKNTGSPRGSLPIPGDQSYAAPELLYGDIPRDWEARRLGSDMFLYGNLVAFVFANASLTAAIMQNLAPAHRPGLWPHDYRTVLPYVRNAFGISMNDIRQALPPSIAGEIGDALEVLCEPDPRLRGHAKDRYSSQFSFERFVSLFDKLATRAEMGLIK